MISKIANSLNWLPFYFKRVMDRKLSGELANPVHVYFCICDHFEPYWNHADSKTAKKRIQRWIAEYPRISEKYLDSDGRSLKYSFFYPQEEYREDDLTEISKLCHSGFGEVEIHLHHDNDTSENLRRTLLDYKGRLYEKHGLLSKNKYTGEISYGFIHGNWALDNSRPDGRWCGVNDEISILQATGCYADLTMPSAPNDTQTRKVNSIYYAVDDPGKPKSHDWGLDAKVGESREGLLMIQGPLCLNWSSRKFGILPRIENSGLYGSNPPSKERVSSWLRAGVSVSGAPEHVFVKIYTHGTQEEVMKMLFNKNGFDVLFESFQRLSHENNFSLHYVSAREMTNTIVALEAAENCDFKSMYDYKYI